MDSQSIIEWGGFAIIAALVFIETGFLIGLVVPGGETLLFTSGVLAGTDFFDTPVYIIIPVLILAAIAGDITGYFIGRKLGPRLKNKENTWYYNGKYLKKAESFYQEKGKTALILGRFVPVVRTMNPLLSGTGKIEFNKFIIYVVIGVVAYITSLVVAGYFLGTKMPWIKDYLKYILPALVLAIAVPVAWKFFKKDKQNDGE